MAVYDRSYAPQAFRKLSVLLFKLSTNAYWSRAWIIQEFILASSIELRCGPDILEEDTLQRFQGILYDASLWHDPVEEPVDKDVNLDHTAMMSIIRHRDDWRSHQSLSSDLQHANTIGLQGTLNSLGLPKPFLTQCADPRDRIFSLLSLLDQNELKNYSITPDYSKSAYSLLLELVSKNRKQEAATKLLQHVKKKDRLNLHKALRSFMDYAFCLAQILEIEYPERASTEAVEKALGADLDPVILKLGGKRKLWLWLTKSASADLLSAYLWWASSLETDECNTRYDIAEVRLNFIRAKEQKGKHHRHRSSSRRPLVS
jgi:hypothetical protein